MAYAQPSDVEIILGRELSTEEEALVTVRLTQAERLILKRIPDLEDRIAADADYEIDVITVEAEAVLRLVRNPDGYTMETDGNYTYQLSASASDNKLTILPDEWDLLGLDRSGANVFVIRPKLNLPWEA